MGNQAMQRSYAFPYPINYFFPGFQRSIPWMFFADHRRWAPLLVIFNFMDFLNGVSLNTALPSIIIEAFPLFLSIWLMVWAVLLSFNNPLLTANPLDILIIWLKFI